MGAIGGDGPFVLGGGLDASGLWPFKRGLPLTARPFKPLLVLLVDACGCTSEGTFVRLRGPVGTGLSRRAELGAVEDDEDEDASGRVFKSALGPRGGALPDIADVYGDSSSPSLL